MQIFGAGSHLNAVRGCLHQTVVQLNAQVVIPDRTETIAQLLNAFNRLLQIFEIQERVEEKRCHAVAHHPHSLGVFDQLFRGWLIHFDETDAFRDDESAEPIHGRVREIMPGFGVVDRRDSLVGRAEVFSDCPISVLRCNVMRRFPGNRINAVGKALFQPRAQFLLDNDLRIS